MKLFFCRVKRLAHQAITSINWIILRHGQELYQAIKCMKAIYDVLAQLFPHWQLPKLPDLP